MNNYEFGQMMYGRGYVAQIRNDILKSVKSGGSTCEAIEGFVSKIRERENKSGVDRAFLRAFDKALDANRV